MVSSPERSSVSDRVHRYRDRLRAQGLRPLQIWIPDTRLTGFAAEAHRQSAAVAASEHVVDEQAFIDALGRDEV